MKDKTRRKAKRKTDLQKKEKQPEAPGLLI